QGLGSIGPDLSPVPIRSSRISFSEGSIEPRFCELLARDCPNNGQDESRRLGSMDSFSAQCKICARGTIGFRPLHAGNSSRSAPGSSPSTFDLSWWASLVPQLARSLLPTNHPGRL